MKAILVEINGRHAVALKQNGEFVEIRNNGHMKTGCEINLPDQSGFNHTFAARMASMAAAFLMTLGLGYGVYTYASPYTYVDVDINPSIEITANRYDRILRVKAFNSDGEKLLRTKGYFHMKLDEGVGEILDSALDSGYLRTAENNAVMLTVSSKDEKKSDKIEQNVEKAAESRLEKSDVESEVVTQKVDTKKLDEARKLGISPGKLTLIDKLQEARPDLDEETVDSYKSASVKQIISAIRNKDKDKYRDKNKYKNEDWESGQQSNVENETSALQYETAGNSDNESGGDKYAEDSGSKPGKDNGKGNEIEFDKDRNEDDEDNGKGNKSGTISNAQNSGKNDNAVNETNKAEKDKKDKADQGKGRLKNAGRHLKVKVKN